MSDPSSASTAWPAARPAGISPIQHPAWEEARNAILDLAAAGPVTAVIVGEAGTGKTWLLRELASSLGDHGFPTMMLMQGDLPMALSSGAALLVDEAALMSAAMRATMSAQQHGVVVLAATEWTADESDPASPGAVIIPLRRLDPEEAAEVAAEWLHRSGLPSSSVDAAGLSRLTAQSDGTIGTLVQSLGAAAAAWRQPRIAPAPAPVAAPVARPIAAVEPPAPAPVPAAIPRRRSVYRPVLAGSAIAAMFALGWALKPALVSRVAPLAGTVTGQQPQTTVALADATPAAPPAPVALGPTAESAAPAMPAPAEPIDPAPSSLPLVRPVEPSASAAVTPVQPAEPAASASVTPVRPTEPAASIAATPVPSGDPVDSATATAVRPAEPAASAAVTPAQPAEPATSAAVTTARPVEPVASVAATPVSPAEPAASAAVPAARPAELPSMQSAEPAEPPHTVVAEAAAPAPATSVAEPLPPLRDAEIPAPAVTTEAVPVQPKTAAPSLASLPPQNEDAATTTPASDATASSPAVASAVPPVLLRSSAPSLIAALAAPAALPVEPQQTLSNGTGGQGLVLIVQRGDTLQSLYGSVYRYRNAPPFATVAAANPRPLKPGAIVVFPEPPGGWKRAQR